MRPGFAQRYLVLHELRLDRRVLAPTAAPTGCGLELCLGRPGWQVRQVLQATLGPLYPDPDDDALGLLGLALVDLERAPTLAAWVARGERAGYPRSARPRLLAAWRATRTAATQLQIVLGDAAYDDLLTLGRAYRRAACAASHR